MSRSRCSSATVAELARSRRGHRHPHRRVGLRVGRGAGGVGLRSLRRVPSALQQRRRHVGRGRPAVGAGAERLAVVLRRERVRRGQRRARVRAADDRIGRRGRHRQHVIGRRRHRAGAVRVGLRREQGRDQLLHRVARAPVLDTGTSLRAAVFYPSGGLLDTGLWTAQRNRPAELARANASTRPGRS